nr:MAG: endo-1,4-beta-xylanase Y [Podoviridae sp. ctka020]
MATYLNAASINWSSASWQADDATSRKIDGSTSTAVTTSNKDSAAFTPGAITVDGVALLMASRITSPTGTLTVILRNSTAGSDVTSVTVNVSDLPNLPSGDAVSPGCPIFFKFSAPQLLLAATNYLIRVVGSVNSEVNFYAGSSDNWNRILRTTTTGSLGAGDLTYIVGEYSGTGANQSFTVTMDNNSTTDFGQPQVGAKGILRYSTAGNTQLRASGTPKVWAAGEFDIGTVGTPVPDGTTAILELDSSSNVEFGVEVYALGTFITQGYNKGYAHTLLAADAASSATSLTVADSVGAAWKNGDSCVLPSTTRTASQLEKKALTADGSGTTLTITALTNAHSGTAPTQGEVGNVTRNVLIRPVGAFSIYIYNNGTWDSDWTEMRDLGSGTTNKRGIDIGTSANMNTNIQYCGIHNTAAFSSSIINVQAINASAALTFSNNVVYGFANGAIQIASTANTSWAMSGNLFCGPTSSAVSTCTMNDFGGTFTNNRITNGGASAVALNITDVNGWGTNSGNVVHSTANAGAAIAPSTTIAADQSLGSLTIWRCNSSGLRVIGGAWPTSLTISTLTAFGNANENVSCSQSAIGDITFISPVLNGDASFSTGAGIRFSTTNGSWTVRIYNGSFGATTAHTSGDIVCGSAGLYQVYTYNTTFASSTEVSSQTQMVPGSFIRSSRHDGVAGAYKAWFKTGTIVNDTTTYNTAAPSEQLTPNNATYKLKSAIKQVALNSGQAANVSVYVRKNAGYTGNQPRLMVQRNDSAGISADTALDTMSVGTGSWEQLSGTTGAVTEDCVLSVYVDCDTGGSYVNVDDYVLTPV